ncbi:MAG TPA: ATP-binding protein [Steroidobacteraceae bacterium]|nr:ATP-binding protein [Steroidobacteraceae bacterium]
MTRHFLGLYVLIVVTLAVVSWGQDRILAFYGSPGAPADESVRVAAAALAERLHSIPPAQWSSIVSDLSRQSGVDIELFTPADIAGPATLQKLARGDTVYMQGSKGHVWSLRRVDGANIVAIESAVPGTRRSALDWLLTLLFYAAIALVLMLWIWPLARDLRDLERAAARFGDKNWSFEARIRPHSQIYPLAQTFRRMAERIDRLIDSHKDMSNAVSHEIKTPLARMQFEIDLAQQAQSRAETELPLRNIKADIEAIDDLVRATLEYAILDRADVTLNIAPHDFTILVPAIADYVRRDTRPEVLIRTQVQEGAHQVLCDIHFMESVLKNLLYNAIRYAKREVAVTFRRDVSRYELLVEDDGPGIPESDRERVFDSFVQLERDTNTKKKSYGLGLAIVKRAVEWHHGEVSIASSILGGARVCITWPNPEGTPTPGRS